MRTDIVEEREGLLPDFPASPELGGNNSGGEKKIWSV